MKRYGYGNSLVEYILPIGVFFAVGIAAVFILDLPAQISEWLAMTGNASLNGSEMSIKPLGSRVSNPYATGSFGRNDSLGSGIDGPYTYPTRLECFGNVCLNLPVIEGETAGGLGGDDVHKMANVLEELAAQLKKEGADEQIIDLVTRLANLGHGMGDRQKELLDLCNSDADGNRTKCDKNKAGQIGDGMKELKEKDLAQFKQMFAILKTYLDNNPGILANLPAAEGVINFESSEIIKMIEAFNLDKKKSGGFLGMGKKTNYYLDNPNEATHQSSDNICEQGGDQQSCNRKKRRNSNNNNNNNSGGG